MDLLSEDEFLQRALQVPMQKLDWNFANRHGVDVLVRRDDLIDSNLSGNKFYKLFYNLQHARANNFKTLLSFGGAYSNHLHALAAAGYEAGFKTIGVIRGERPKILNPMLQDAERWGMQLHFMSREDYKQKTSPEINEGLRKIYGDFYVIPEGGSNALGFKGTQKMGWALQQKLKGDYTSICLACGTGNTLAGVAAGVMSENTFTSDDQHVIGFSVLKGDGSLGADIIAHHENIDTKTIQTKPNNWRLISGYHVGGYGKKLPQAVQKFVADFEIETSLLLDPVYTAKMFWGVLQLLEQGYWPRGSRLVLVHTGGLQGRRGFKLS